MKVTPSLADSRALLDGHVCRARYISLRPAPRNSEPRNLAAHWYSSRGQRDPMSKGPDAARAPQRRERSPPHVPHRRRSWLPAPVRAQQRFRRLDRLLDQRAQPRDRRHVGSPVVGGSDQLERVVAQIQREGARAEPHQRRPRRLRQPHRLGADDLEAAADLGVDRRRIVRRSCTGGSGATSRAATADRSARRSVPLCGRRCGRRRDS